MSKASQAKATLKGSQVEHVSLEFLDGATAAGDYRILLCKAIMAICGEEFEEKMVTIARALTEFD